MTNKLGKALACAVLGVTAGPFVSMIPAQAAGQDSLVQQGEFVFYYNSNCPSGVGISDFVTSKADLAGYRFLGGGSWPGVNQLVKNNSACAQNLNSTGARVYFNSGYVGVNDFIPRGVKLNLTNTYNDNASWRWAEGGAN